MSKKEREYCFYCSGLVSGKALGVGDHFPIPKHLGGTETVPCCVSCHDMKDRFPLDRWPYEWFEKVFEDMPEMSRETRIYIAKSLRMYSEYLNVTKGTQVPLFND